MFNSPRNGRRLDVFLSFMCTSCFTRDRHLCCGCIRYFAVEMHAAARFVEMPVRSISCSMQREQSVLWRVRIACLPPVYLTQCGPGHAHAPGPHILRGTVGAFFLTDAPYFGPSSETSFLVRSSSRHIQFGSKFSCGDLTSCASCVARSPFVVFYS